MTNIKRFYIITISLLVWASQCALAQSKLADYTAAQIDGYKNKVEDQVRFLEYLLNTLGDSKASQRDKDVIIKNSYQKVFLSAEVQVEDDLTEGRKVITNKDITAYLKDIDFFFKGAHFDFEIKEIEVLEKPNGGIYFKVSINRTLKATGLEGEAVLNTKPRFIEINLDEASDELKIASIYTTKVSKDKALKEWWKQLSFGWRDLFLAAIGHQGDSISLANLNKIAALDSLDLSGNTIIQNIDPLSMLSDLAYLNLENSAVKEINALSSLTNLKDLNLSNTAIANLQFIQYAENIERLILDYTQVTDLTPIQKFSKLKVLSLKATPVESFEIIGDLVNLEHLNLTDTRFADKDSQLVYGLTKLKALYLSKTTISTLEQLIPTSLKELDVTFTTVSQLKPLSEHPNLEILSISNSQVRLLAPLLSLPKLQRVYADHLFLDAATLTNFKNERPKVLLVVDSEELTSWWASLDLSWKNKLKAYMPNVSVNMPSKEALSKLVTLDSLQLSNAGIEQLFPIKKFNRLTYLDLSNNEINSIDPLSDLTGLLSLNLAGNRITSLRSLNYLRKLQTLDLSDNPLKAGDLVFIERLNQLNQLDLNGLNLQKEVIKKLLIASERKCLIRYNDKAITAWWAGLEASWKQIFNIQQQMSEQPELWQLTALLQQEQIVIADEKLLNLNPLKQFVSLTALYLEHVDLGSYDAFADFNELKVLHIKKTPFSDLNVVSSLSTLEQLNLDFTAVDDLRALENLTQLQALSLVGTPLRSMKGVSELFNLTYLNIASTEVRWMNRVNDLPNLETLICYNTRIWESWIKKYRSDNPDCEITWY